MHSQLSRWFDALQERHLASLEWAEVTRALRALSSAYVQRRSKLGAGGALDGRGKRAAFALFYGPLHFAAVAHIVEQLRGADAEAWHASTVVDAGCGTGAAGAAWALSIDAPPSVLGVDVHPWAVVEAAWTYRFFDLDARAMRGDLARLRVPSGAAIVAAYALNELAPEPRTSLIDRAIERRHPLLVIEPIARGITPWWDETAARITAAGGRADDWKFPLEMPDRWRLLDRAAGFRRTHLTARSLWLPARRALSPEP